MIVSIRKPGSHLASLLAQGANSIRADPFLTGKGAAIEPIRQAGLGPLLTLTFDALRLVRLPDALAFDPIGAFGTLDAPIVAFDPLDALLTLDPIGQFGALQPLAVDPPRTFSPLETLTLYLLPPFRALNVLTLYPSWALSSLDALAFHLRPLRTLSLDAPRTICPLDALGPLRPLRFAVPVILAGLCTGIAILVALARCRSGHGQRRDASDQKKFASHLHPPRANKIL